MKVHPFIEAEKIAGHGVQRACPLLEVSRAAYYQRRNGVPSPRAVADAAITAKIAVIHEESGERTGRRASTRHCAKTKEWPAGSGGSPG